MSIINPTRILGALSSYFFLADTVASGTIAAGDIVVVDAAAPTGRFPKVSRASAAALSNFTGPLKIAVNGGTAGKRIRVTDWWVRIGRDTSGLSVGPIYLTTAGAYSSTPGTYRVPVGYCLVSSSTAGVVFLNPNGGAADVLAELAGVTTGKGAAMVGVVDAGGYTTTTTVEAYLAELGATRVRTASGTIPAGNGAGNVGDLNTAPVTIVAAPGAGFWLEPIILETFLDYGGAAYDTAATLQLRTVGGASWLGTAIPSASLLGASADARFSTTAGPANLAVTENAGLELFASADPFGAAGNSPLKWRLHYRVNPLLS